ncbi:MAG: hypothetical protein APG12_01737 [Candidatus Methanofastidiosum methylothiophilum]|uniref:Uncharacterized protein n=1 Tax=Candidatus Methanofastidiosum methylothiophilum TaxID=1705564 RepID=A0A150IPQ4_9EURY|nr:MAG: hypothetical protein APG10_01826 [Candidatus Methanofastidiosum methylthiophilus]KYC46868.1 MAG: hypothetical protein APG11_01627 [Candidatus Methanofastidiosum methylthiophilus]KYC48965.1 MAG: hypothetical protein APG12_01737 [Candidatus Methanofastidiosum methylthiophilus]
MEKKYSEFEMKIISYYDTHRDLLHSLAMYDDVILQAIALTLIKTAEDIKKRN